MAIINAVTLRRSFTIATAALFTSCLAASAQINITGAGGETINLGPNGIEIHSGGSHVRLSPGSINATSSGATARVSTRSSKVKVKSKVKATARASASASTRVSTSARVSSSISAESSPSSSSSSSSSTVVINKRGKAGTSHVSMQSRNGVSNISTNVNGRQTQFTAVGPVAVEADTNGTTINGIRVNDNTVNGITVDGLNSNGISIDGISLNGANGITINGRNPYYNPNFNARVSSNVNPNFNVGVNPNFNPNFNNSRVEVLSSQALSLSGDLAINDNHRNAVYNANNQGIAIYGNHCTIQLQGPCREIAIYGNHNTVIAEVVGRVAVMGNYNATRWTNMPAPQVVVLGKDNMVQGPGYP